MLWLERREVPIAHWGHMVVSILPCGWKMVKDREAWCPVVHGVAKNWMQLSNWTTTKKEDAPIIFSPPGLCRCQQFKYQARNSFLESEQNYVFPRFGRQGSSQSIFIQWFKCWRWVQLIQVHYINLGKEHLQELHIK